MFGSHFKCLHWVIHFYGIVVTHFYFFIRRMLLFDTLLWLKNQTKSNFKIPDYEPNIVHQQNDKGFFIMYYNPFYKYIHGELQIGRHPLNEQII